MRRLRLAGIAVAALVAVLAWRALRGREPAVPPGWAMVDHVADGDTVVLRGHVTVRLVQVDTPEVYFRPECFGEQASAETKALLPPRTLVRLVREPAGDATDRYGRLLRYVIRSDGLNVNLRLVADGAAAPYFFDGERGRYADALLRSAERARARGLGLWGACAGTALAPGQGVSTGPVPG